MRMVAVAAGILLIATAQVAVAPLFPVLGSTAELPLAAAAILAWARGVKSLTVALPAIAIATGLVAGRDLGLYLVGYAALLPASALAGAYRWPLGSWPGALVALVATGIWFRSLLVVAALLDGAHVTAPEALRYALLPGAVADAVFYAAGAATVGLLRLLHDQPLRATRSREAFRWP